MKWGVLKKLVSDPGRIRTCDRLIRSQMLYPLSYGTIFLLSIVCHTRISNIFPEPWLLLLLGILP